jgi:hypothetical protein
MGRLIRLLQTHLSHAKAIHHLARENPQVQVAFAIRLLME